MSKAAFPVIESNFEGHPYCTDTGMSLRDYFAAKAMQSLVNQATKTSAKLVAEDAYKIADAMMAERKI